MQPKWHESKQEKITDKQLNNSQCASLKISQKTWELLHKEMRFYL